ncbi:MAG: PilT/PilU family type 4a pilus ATPase [Deltaproteobacteria bacterium]|nr:PilT/PilU family type 4a pilus ATPase [Deltaproteobacteria bacterium]
MEIRELLKVMVERGASDLYLTTASPPMYRIEGITQPIGNQSLTPDMLRELADSFMSRTEKLEFGEKLEMTLALAYEGLGRFRVNVFRQRGNVGIVIRQIKSEILTIDQLLLPSILKSIAMSKRGLALVVGATGSGKSTTLAAMVEHRNVHSVGHIISIEDPIEFVHCHKKSIINQREIGLDTHSFKEALRNAMRQAPDVIVVGEIREPETMEAAITFADTGHLCLGTLHSTNADQSFERILNFFPENRHPQILMQLSLNLRCIISQRLVISQEHKRVVAMEILMDTPRVKNLIKRGEIDIIKEAMEQGIHEGCQTFDQALFMLYKEGKISLEQALANADSANNLRLKINLEGMKGADAIDRLIDKGKKDRAKSLHIKGV